MLEISELQSAHRTISEQLQTAQSQISSLEMLVSYLKNTDPMFAAYVETQTPTTPMQQADMFQPLLSHFKLDPLFDIMDLMLLILRILCLIFRMFN